jgi:hypothetical protein
MIRTVWLQDDPASQYVTLDLITGLGIFSHRKVVRKRKKLRIFEVKTVGKRLKDTNKSLTKIPLDFAPNFIV